MIYSPPPRHASGPGSSLSAHSMRAKSGASLDQESLIAPDSMPVFGSFLGDSEEEEGVESREQSRARLDAGASEGTILRLASGIEPPTTEEGAPVEIWSGRSPEGPGITSQLLGESRLSSFFVGSGFRMAEQSRTHVHYGDLPGVTEGGESTLQDPSRVLTATDVVGFVQSRVEVEPCRSRLLLQVPSGGGGHWDSDASLPQAGHRLEEGGDGEGRGVSNVMSSYLFRWVPFTELHSSRPSWCSM